MVKEESELLKNDRNNNGGQSIHYLNRIINILEYLNQGHNTLTTISRACNCSISSTHRLLKGLVEAGLVLRDKTQPKYYFGPKFSQIASNFVTNHQFLILCATGEMSRLSNLTRETVGMRIQIGMLSYHLYQIGGKINLDIPVVEPVIPTGPINKVFLSLLSNRDLLTLLKGWVYAGDYEDPQSKVDEFMEEITKIKEQGYALGERFDRYPGVIAFAVPVYNYAYPVGLTCIGLEKHMVPSLPDYIREFKVSATRIAGIVAETVSPQT